MTTLAILLLLSLGANVSMFGLITLYRRRLEAWEKMFEDMPAPVRYR